MELKKYLGEIISIMYSVEDFSLKDTGVLLSNENDAILLRRINDDFQKDGYLSVKNELVASVTYKRQYLLAIEQVCVSAGQRPEPEQYPRDNASVFNYLKETQEPFEVFFDACSLDSRDFILKDVTDTFLIAYGLEEDGSLNGIYYLPINKIEKVAWGSRRLKAIVPSIKRREAGLTKLDENPFEPTCLLGLLRDYSDVYGITETGYAVSHNEDFALIASVNRAGEASGFVGLTTEDVFAYVTKSALLNRLDALASANNAIPNVGPMKSLDSLKKLLEYLCRTQELASVYFEDEDCCGYIDEVCEETCTIEIVDGLGRRSGFIIVEHSRIEFVEFGTLYNTKLAQLNSSL